MKSANQPILPAPFWLRSALFNAQPRRAHTFQVSFNGTIFWPMHTCMSSSISEVDRRRPACACRLLSQKLSTVFYLRSCQHPDSRHPPDLKSSAVKKHDRELGHSPESRHVFSSLFISLFKGGSFRASLCI